ncbi:MAG TPA: NmrA family NAD(P)-binding protein [Candidatus Mediterraneibacter norfolkensis]|nr:NmrA family NAD(P)-binding protein [Candidatus Mediterraneibacter norfolkensis]
MVLITGAGGQVGTTLLQALSAEGIRTRAWIHRAEQKETVITAGASEVFVGDLTLTENAVQAMSGVDTVYFICNAANPQEDTIGSNLIETAKKLGDITFIYHSVLHSLLSDMPHHDRKRKVEKTLVDSGIPYVILQPAVFMQMLAPSIQSIKKGGVFVQKFYTSSQTKMSFVDIKDYAEAAAKIVASGAFTYGTYELCSNGTYSLTDMENILSELMERKVTSAYIPDEDFLATSHLPADSYAGRTLLTMFRHYNENSFCGSSYTLTKILGRNPVTIRDYFVKVLSE